MSRAVPTCREDVTKTIQQQKVLLQKNWQNLAVELNQSVVWTVAACQGQAQLTPQQSQIVGSYFGLTREECLFLEAVPTKNTLNGKTPSDPLLHRLHEALGVYGPAMKEAIHEEFGDGVMSAIDFSCTIEREADPNGDRVKMVWSGKLLPAKKF